MNKKETVLEFLTALNNHDTESAGKYLTKDFIQHNPFIASGSDGILSLFPRLKEQKTSVKNIRVFEDGDFVVTHNVWNNATPFGAEEMVSFDVFRINKEGVISEHWDALMPDAAPNPSGRKLTEGPTEIAHLDKTEENKKLLIDLFETMINGTPEEGGAAFQNAFAMDYKQYNPNAGDGWEGFMGAQMASGTPRWVFTKQHKVLGQGDYVLSIAEGTENGVPSAYYDLVRIENGKIVDHWDVVQAIPKEGVANENGMFNYDVK